MKGPHRLPDFSVVVWIKRNEHFPALQSELLAAEGGTLRNSEKSRHGRFPLGDQ